MAIYRPPKPRWPLATGAGVAGLLCGVLIGLALGSSDPDPSEAAAEIQSSLVAAAGSLEVAGIEYDEAVSGGEIEAQAEYDGALAAVASSRTRYQEVRGALDILAPEQVDRLDGLYERCRELMTLKSEASDVLDCFEELEGALEGGS